MTEEKLLRAAKLSIIMPGAAFLCILLVGILVRFQDSGFGAIGFVIPLAFLMYIGSALGLVFSIRALTHAGKIASVSKNRIRILASIGLILNLFILLSPLFPYIF